MPLFRIVIPLLATAIALNPLVARAKDASDEDLAKQTQNPIADLISLPFQNNTSFGLGREDRTQNVLNIQPVIPVQLNEDWNLINRTILPLVYQPDVRSSSGGKFGVGDIDHTSWLSPTTSGGFVWGIGPAFLLPTSTQKELGTEKFSLGPSFVGLIMEGPWVAGALAKHFWSVAGHSGRSHVNLSIVQPFVNYNLDAGWYLVSSPILQGDWSADGGDELLVPLGGGVGRVFRIGEQPINTSIQAFGNAVRPSGGSEWSLRFQIQLLFPKGK
jgi:hypothetical protein